MEEQIDNSQSATVSNPTTVVKEERQNIVPTTTEQRPVNTGLENINLLNPAEIERAKAFLTDLMRSEKGGIKSVNDGLAMIMRAQDLNIPFSTALEHVHVINGKTGIDIHVIKALLLRAGVTWDMIDDYTPLYEYTDSINVYVDGSFPEYVIKCKSSEEAKEKAKNDVDNVYVYPVRFYKDFNGNIYRDYQLNANYAVVSNKQQATQVMAEKKIPIFRVPNIPVDYITRYKFERVINNKLMTAIGKFSYSEAIKAELFEKDTYKKYPRIFIGHRAFTYGAREIASDVVLGSYETNELKIITNSPIDESSLVDIQ